MAGPCLPIVSGLGLLCAGLPGLPAFGVDAGLPVVAERIEAGVSKEKDARSRIGTCLRAVAEELRPASPRFHHDLAAFPPPTRPAPGADEGPRDELRRGHSTVHRAIAMLKEEGLVEASRGRRAIVSARTAGHPVEDAK